MKKIDLNKKHIVSSKCFGIALSFLISCSFSSAAHAIKAQSEVVNPFLEMDPYITKPSGTVVDEKYGVMTYFSGTEMEIASSLEDKTILAPEKGRVIYVDENHDKYGTLVKIVHRNGSVSTFGGLDTATIPSLRDRFEKGDEIGAVKHTDKVYFEHVLKSGYSVSYNEKDSFRTSIIVNKDKMSVGTYYKRGYQLDGNYAFSFSDIFNNSKDSDKKSGSVVGVSKTINSGTYGTGTPSSSGGSSPSYMPIASTGAAGVAYSSFPASIAGAAVGAIAAAANPLCPASVSSDLILPYQEAATAGDIELLKANFTPPPEGLVNELSCFDQFSTVMSTVVAESGISGGFDIFGVGVDVGSLVNMGMNALADGACDKANDLLGKLRDKGLDVNVMYAGRETQLEILGSYKGTDFGYTGSPLSNGNTGPVTFD